jgi:hypothetical protein
MASLQMDLIPVPDEQVVTALEGSMRGLGTNQRFNWYLFEGVVLSCDFNGLRANPQVSEVLTQRGYCFRKAEAICQMPPNGSCTITFNREVNGNARANLDLSGNASNDADLSMRVAIAFRKAFTPLSRQNVLPSSRQK